jgi:hypothetical protein
MLPGLWDSVEPVSMEYTARATSGKPVESRHKAQGTIQQAAGSKQRAGKKIAINNLPIPVQRLLLTPGF